jgi:hypothetical protein
MRHMSESAAEVNQFFLPLLLTITILDTLRVAGAEDRAPQGCDPSADSGAKTRLGFGETLSPSGQTH